MNRDKERQRETDTNRQTIRLTVRQTTKQTDRLRDITFHRCSRTAPDLSRAQNSNQTSPSNKRLQRGTQRAPQQTQHSLIIRETSLNLEDTQTIKPIVPKHILRSLCQLQLEGLCELTRRVWRRERAASLTQNTGPSN